MESNYNEPMYFDPDLLPKSTRASESDLLSRLWDYGVETAGQVKRYGRQTPTLAECDFNGGEKLLAVKSYLYGHGKYQLIRVSISDWCSTGCIVVFLV